MLPQSFGDKRMTRSRVRYDYDNPHQRPPYGEPEDWGYDNMFGVWVYVGDDKELEKRWNKELDLVESGEWDYERPIHASDLVPDSIIYHPSTQYDTRFERPARWTVWAVAGFCVAIAIALLRA